MAGYVYLLTNQSMPGLLKLGCTERPLSERIAELSAATGVPTPFVVEYSIFVADPLATERQLHIALEKYRVNDGREFFRMAAQEAKRYLQGKQLDLTLAEILTWDDEHLLKLVDAILSKRPSVRAGLEEQRR